MSAPISILILAAGRGIRYDPSGTRHKLLEPLPNGRSVIETSCEAALEAGYEVLVLCGAHRAGIDAALQGMDVRIETCGRADAGMAATLKHGLMLTRPATGWIVLLGDMPGVQLSAIQSVAEGLAEGAALARPYVAGRPGHPVGISRRMEDAFLALPDTDSGGRVFRAHADETLRIHSNDYGCVNDIDYPEDMAKFRYCSGNG